MWSHFATLLAVVAACFHAMGILSAAHAVWNCRTSTAAIAWSVTLMIFPYLAVPAYWILGRDRFEGYRRAFREGGYDRAAEAEYLQLIQQYWVRPSDAMAQIQLGYETLAHFPVTAPNKIDLLVDGEEIFRVMFEEIDKAENYILLEFFLIADDQVGRELRDHLIARAKAGVRIYFVYDEFGSLGLPGRYLRELRDAGIKIFPFYPARVGAGRLQYNFRNHRKIVVVDGKVALVGGANVHDDTLGRNPFYGDWRETHLRVRGPSVSGIQLAFLDDYYWATDGQSPEDIDLKPYPAEDGKEAAVYVASGPADEADEGMLFFIHSIHSARHRLWLATPYFVPVPSVLDALKAASLRGVDVKIIIPLRWDLLIMYMAAYSYFPDSEQAGIQIYRYSAGHPHHKVMLIDDNVAWVGSSNLDVRSMQLNFEGNMVVFGQDFAAQVEAMFKEDLARSQPMGLRDYERRSLLFKTGVKLARLFETFL